MTRYVLPFVIVFLPACSTVDIAGTPLAKATHADLLGAAAVAKANGYPGRAAVWTAIDTQLTACENAITANAPKVVASPQPAGPLTALEVGAETVGSVTGIPAAVKINCTAFPLIVFPLK